MKWYKIQKAFEDGAKIRRSLWCDQYHIEYDKTYMSHIKEVRNYLGKTTAKGIELTNYNLFANDWIIVEDAFPEVHELLEQPTFFRCPRCNELSQIWERDRKKEVIRCGNCNKGVKLVKEKVSIDKLSVKNYWKVKDFYSPHATWTKSEIDEFIEKDKMSKMFRCLVGTNESFSHIWNAPHYMKEDKHSNEYDDLRYQIKRLNDTTRLNKAEILRLDNQVNELKDENIKFKNNCPILSRKGA